MFTLPIMIGMIVILLHVNSAIQVSIVDQQYARAQETFLAYNSNTYPRLALRVAKFDNAGMNQMILGVSDNLASAQGYQAQATTQLVTRVRGPAAYDPPQEEPATRALVRIRNSISLCTQVNSIISNGKPGPVLPVTCASGGGDNPKCTVGGPSALNEGTTFEYCRKDPSI